MTRTIEQVEAELRAERERVAVLEEFYAAWQDLQTGITDFDLHAKVVARFKRALAALTPDPEQP